MVIDYPTGAQEDRLRTLWHLAFGDSEEFVTGFFSSAYSPRRCRCAAENGNIFTPWRPTRISGTGGFAAL